MKHQTDDSSFTLPAGMVVAITISSLDKPGVRRWLFDVESELGSVDGLESAIPGGMGPGPELPPVADAFIALGGDVGGIIQGIDILWKWLSVQRSVRQDVNEIKDPRDVVIRLRTEQGELVLTADSLPDARRLVEQAHQDLGHTKKPRRSSCDPGRG